MLQPAANRKRNQSEGVFQVGKDWSLMVNGQWSMVNGQWSMVNGQWSMVNRRFAIFLNIFFDRVMSDQRLEISILTIDHSPFHPPLNFINDVSGCRRFL